jgi:hypothetical protein
VKLRSGMDVARTEEKEKDHMGGKHHVPQTHVIIDKFSNSRRQNLGLEDYVYRGFLTW